MPKPQMIGCSNCGRQLLATFRACPRCGATLNGQVPRPREAPGNLPGATRTGPVLVLPVRSVVIMSAAAAVFLIIGGSALRFIVPRNGPQLEAPGSTALSGALTVKADRDGQYHLVVTVNGIKARFLVDTGASDVTLNQQLAKGLGFNLSKLDYDQTYTTANGITRGAPVVLREMAVGSLRVHDHPASVNQGDLDEPLLGMQFLKRLGSIEIKNGHMTLRW